MTILDLSSREFLSELASKKSTPGGGAVAAISGAQAAALVSMVLELTRKLPENVNRNEILDEVRRIQFKFSALAQQDIDGFNALMDAYKTGQMNDDVLKGAIEAPLECLQQIVNLVNHLETTHEFGNPNLTTDTAIAALLMLATIQSSELNVLVNLRSMKDESFKASALEKIAEASQHTTRLNDIATEIRDSLT